VQLLHLGQALGDDALHHLSTHTARGSGLSVWESANGPLPDPALANARVWLLRTRESRWKKGGTFRTFRV
jgi:hypothetical protein